MQSGPRLVCPHCGYAVPNPGADLPVITADWAAAAGWLTEDVDEPKWDGRRFLIVPGMYYCLGCEEYRLCHDVYCVSCTGSLAWRDGWQINRPHTCPCGHGGAEMLPLNTGGPLPCPKCSTIMTPG